MKINRPSKFDKDCAEIARLTNENAHTEALIKLAQMLGNDKYAKILGHLRDIHHLEGHLTRTISAFRDDIAMKLFDNAYATCDAVSFSQIKRAF
jgi:hypothetical protein